MVVRVVVTVLSGVGLYVSLFMLGKTRRAERGELEEPSVVQTARARLYGGVPNALLGVLYYPALVAGIWLLHQRAAAGALVAVAVFAAATSVVLAYSLLYVTKRSCPYCWTAHAINWSLAIVLVASFGELTASTQSR
jgi:uncharacterized membrane protein